MMSFRKAAKLFGKIVESAEVKEDNRHEEDGSALERVRRRNNGHIEEETRLEVCELAHQDRQDPRIQLFQEQGSHQRGRCATSVHGRIGWMKTPP